MIIPKNPLAIIRFLSENGERNINQISRELKISVGSAFKILKDFENRGIVSSRRMGNAIFYSVNATSREAQLLLELSKLAERGEVESTDGAKGLA